ncbi:MAG: DUF6599 family protein [Armatimonadota bacterium]
MRYNASEMQALHRTACNIAPRRTGPVWRASVAVALLCTLTAAAVAREPRVPAGWRQAQPVRTISGDEIYDYMDGAGEIPKACGYRSLKVFTYTGPAGTQVTVEMYDMGSSANAFGLYSMKRGPDSRTIRLDHRAAFGHSDLVLWKDRHTFIIFSEGQKRASEATLIAFARAFSMQVPGRGQLPDLLRYLPRNGYVENSVKFFHGKPALDTIKFLPKDVFGLRAFPEAAVAQYARPRGTAMVIRYPSVDAASDAETRCRRMLEARGTQVVRYGRMLGAVWGAPSTSAAAQLLRRVANTLRKPGPVWREG